MIYAHSAIARLSQGQSAAISIILDIFGTLGNLGPLTELSTAYAPSPDAIDSTARETWSSSQNLVINPIIA